VRLPGFWVQVTERVDRGGAPQKNDRQNEVRAGVSSARRRAWLYERQGMFSVVRWWQSYVIIV
jgi:hypothetical protein